MKILKLRTFQWAVYGVSLLLVLVPLLDSVLAVWPLQPGQVTWRFGALGLFSRAVMTPVLGLVVGLVAAAVFEQRAWMRLFAALSFTGAATFLVSIGMFMLDALDARVLINPEAAQSFDIASLVAILKFALGVGLCALLGIGGWKASAQPRGGSRGGKESPARGKGDDLLVARTSRE